MSIELKSVWVFFCLWYELCWLCMQDSHFFCWESKNIIAICRRSSSRLLKSLIVSRLDILLNVVLHGYLYYYGWIHTIHADCPIWIKMMLSRVKNEEKRKKWRNNSNIFTLKTFAFVSHLMSFRDIEQLTKILCWWRAGYYGWKSFYCFFTRISPFPFFSFWNDDARSWLSISSNHIMYKYNMSMYLM